MENSKNPKKLLGVTLLLSLCFCQRIQDLNIEGNLNLNPDRILTLYSSNQNSNITLSEAKTNVRTELSKKRLVVTQGVNVFIFDLKQFVEQSKTKYISANTLIRASDSKQLVDLLYTRTQKTLRSEEREETVQCQLANYWTSWGKEVMYAALESILPSAHANYDFMNDISNPANPLSPLNPIYQDSGPSVRYGSKKVLMKVSTVQYESRVEFLEPHSSVEKIVLAYLTNLSAPEEIKSEIRDITNCQ
ncbi:MAG: hypothetical protein KA116_07660 [Proteobacteria bacterium]|nr:hypothetical protein [Pseudomonadota bacterium]